MSTAKTFLLMSILTGILVGLGILIGGTPEAALPALLMAFVMNILTYWFSDKIVLWMYRAKEVTEAEAPKLHRIVRKIAEFANLPMPRVYLMNSPTPNAFATGRSPKSAAVAVTTGIMELLNDDELEGVISHELAHVRNRDTLISTMAAVIAGAIGYLAYALRWYGGGDSRERRSNAIVALLVSLFVPLVATIIRLAISRTREFSADKDGAEICHKPLALASALEKIERGVHYHPLIGNSATSNLFIVNPFTTDSFFELFSTHPRTAERIRRLRSL